VQFAPSSTAVLELDATAATAATALSVEVRANAAVTAAGVEPLGTSTVTTAATVAMSTTGAAATGAVNSASSDTKGWCSATEARLLSEAGSSGAARALLLIQMARFRCSSSTASSVGTDSHCNGNDDTVAAAAAAAEQLLKQAAAALADTEARESALLNEAVTRLSEANTDVNTLSLLTCPPAPAVLSRGATWIVVQLPPFKLKAHAHSSSTTASSSNSTRQHGTAAAAAAAAAAVHCVKVFAKPGGSGVAVSTNSNNIAGTGVPVCYDASTGSSSAVRVRGLVPCTSYVFAAAAYDAAGNQVS
jgi:hypothetical protein